MPKKQHLLFTSAITDNEIEKLSLIGISTNSFSFINVTYKKPHYSFVEGDCWAFTSKHGIRAIKPYIESFPTPNHIFAVGEKTAADLKKYGYVSMYPSIYNATYLAQLIQKYKPKRIIHFCGDLIRKELSNLLFNFKISLVEIPVYTTTLINKKIDSSLYTGIVFMSPSAVKAFFSKNTIHRSTLVYSIGPVTAKEVEKYFEGEIIISRSATSESLLESIIQNVLNFVP